MMTTLNELSAIENVPHVKKNHGNVRHEIQGWGFCGFFRICGFFFQCFQSSAFLRISAVSGTTANEGTRGSLVRMTPDVLYCSWAAFDTSI